MTKATDLDKLADLAHEAYSIIDDIAFKQKMPDGDDTYLVFTEFIVKIKYEKELYCIKVDSDMQRIVIEQLDESEEVPF